MGLEGRESEQILWLRVFFLNLEEDIQAVIGKNFTQDEFKIQLAKLLAQYQAKLKAELGLGRLHL